MFWNVIISYDHNVTFLWIHFAGVKLNQSVIRVHCSSTSSLAMPKLQQLLKIVLSSAKLQRFSPFKNMKRSFINILRSRTPRTDLCSKPLITVSRVASILTLCFCLSRSYIENRNIKQNCRHVI